MPLADRAFALNSSFLGPLPIVNHFLARLGLGELFDHRLPPLDPRCRVSAARALLMLLRSLIVNRIPLYRVSEWAASMLPVALGLSDDEVGALNDDRLGRALDALFDCDRQLLLTDIVLRMVQEFRIRLDELHNDSTTLTLQGEYRQADGREVYGQTTHRITLGHNKDGCPDLKQLLWILTVSTDGAVPVHFKVDDGNVEDSTTHIPTWEVLRQLVGNPDFLYVADCKLCSSETLRHIDRQHGAFLTILPSNHKENRLFRQWLTTHDPDWQEITRIHRPGSCPDDVISALESPIAETNGFRLVWFLSSEKIRRDADRRQETLLRAVKDLETLEKKLQGPRCRFRVARSVRKAADEILSQTGAARWIDYTVERVHETTEVHEQRSCPRGTLHIRRSARSRFRLTWQFRQEAVRADALSDGIVPLVTNRYDLSPLQLYVAYRGNQPLVETRHDLLKNTLQVVPAFLHNVHRLEALLFLEYLALTVHALIERELRQSMADAHIPKLPLYPEARDCSAPTAARIFDLFEHVQVHTLWADGHKLQSFEPQLTPLQLQLLDILHVPTASYFG
jgi:transposase